MRTQRNKGQLEGGGGDEKIVQHVSKNAVRIFAH